MLRLSRITESIKTGLKDFNSLPQSDIGSCVALVRFLDLIKLEIESRVLGQVAGSGQLFDEGEELVVVAPVVVELDLTDELDLDALMFETARLPVQGYVHLKRKKNI